MLLLLAFACTHPADKGTDDTDPEPEPEFVCPYQPPASWPGCRVEQANDPRNDGKDRLLQTTVYDDLNRAISWQYVNEADSDDDVSCTYDWMDGADPWGDPWPLTEVCDGRSEWTYTWSYDVAVEPAGKVYDRGTDGVIDRTWAYATDGQGRVIEELIDQDADGVVDSTTVHQYDDDGNRVRSDWDYDGDGTNDHSRTWVWSAVDWGFVLDREEQDEEADGTLDAVTTWTHDANGNLLEEIEDSDGDGNENAATTWVWQRQADDSCRVAEVRSFEVGVGASLSVYEYDVLGALDRIEIDWDSDGKVDEVESWTYDCGSR